MNARYPGFTKFAFTNGPTRVPLRRGAGRAGAEFGGGGQGAAGGEQGAAQGAVSVR